MDDNTIYVVQGRSGEYADKVTWPIAYYFSEEEAKNHRDLADKEAQRIIEKYKYKYKIEEDNKYDPLMELCMDYFSDVSYSVYGVDKGIFGNENN